MQNYLLGKKELREEILKKYVIIKNLTDIDGTIKEQGHIDMPDKMTLGVELEIIGPASDYLYGTLIKGFNGDRDSTIQDEKYPGVEITSPILKSNNIDDVLGVAKQLVMLGQSTNKSCGGHIHIGSKYLDVKDDERKTNVQATKIVWKSFLEMWKNCEEIMYKITTRASEEHRGIEFAKPIASKIEKMLQCDDAEMNVYQYKEMIKMVQTEEEPIVDERYFSVNFTNLNLGKNTIEFRLANGTIDSQELKANIELFIAFVDISRRIGIVRYKEESKSELTPKEYELLKKYRKVCLKQEISEEEKKNELLDMLFEPDKRNIYNERYEKSTFDIEKEEQKSKNIERQTQDVYGAPLSDEELEQIEGKYDFEDINARNKIKFNENDLDELIEEVQNERKNVFMELWERIINWRQNRRGEEKQKKDEEIERF